MFKVLKKTKDGFDKLVLVDEATTTSVEVIPSCGAMLHAFKVNDSLTGALNIIDSYASKTAFDESAEKLGFRGLKLSPYPCRIKDAEYNFNGRTFFLKEGRPGFTAIHGFLYNKSFEVKTVQEGPEAAMVELEYAYDGSNSGYPFPYTCTVYYILEAQNTLTLNTVITNIGSQTIPIADGWHPYFSFGKKVDGLQMQLQSNNMVVFENLIPTGALAAHNEFTEPDLIGTRELDNSFVADFTQKGPHCVLTDRARGWQLAITPGLNYPYLQIYIPPHRNSIAIENLSAPPDAFNNGMHLHLLEPGDQISFDTCYRLQRISRS